MGWAHALSAGERRKREAKACEAVAAFNERYPLGTAVLFTPRFGWGPSRIERTRCDAYVFDRQIALIWVTNHGVPVRVEDVKPVDEFSYLRTARPLVRAARGFGLMLHVDPTMSHDGPTVDTVASGGLDPHPPEFAMLLLHVLEWKHNLLTVVETEGIEQIPYMLRLDEAANVAFLLGVYTELCIQLIRCLEHFYFDGLPRWRGRPLFRNS